MSTRERIHFRLIQTPCCSTLLCWVNSRLPNRCPECGSFILAQLRTIKADLILISDQEAWIEYSDQK